MLTACRHAEYEFGVVRKTLTSQGARQLSPAHSAILHIVQQCCSAQTSAILHTLSLRRRCPCCSTRVHVLHTNSYTSLYLAERGLPMCAYADCTCKWDTHHTTPHHHYHSMCWLIWARAILHARALLLCPYAACACMRVLQANSKTTRYCNPTHLCLETWRLRRLYSNSPLSSCSTLQTTLIHTGSSLHKTKSDFHRILVDRLADTVHNMLSGLTMLSSFSCGSDTVPGASVRKLRISLDSGCGDSNNMGDN
jgi:hypothetical protein